jgi:nuclear pore complex protein Nup54
MGTAAPGGMNGDEVVEGEKLWSNLWGSTNTLRESALR